MLSDDIEKLQNEIAEQNVKLEALKRAQEELALQAPEYQLAIRLHDSFCRWNHTDGCGWHYEITKGVHDWNGHSHGSWLKKARRVLTDCDNETGNIEMFFKVKAIIDKID
jgi:hypothetical protein